MINTIKCTLTLMLIFYLTGCTKTLGLGEGAFDSPDDPVSLLENTLLLPIAEKRLLSAINGRRIVMLSELSYLAGDPSYLIVDGVFNTDFGSVRDAFVLRLDEATDSWGNAEVYRWESSKVDYVDCDGTKIERHLLYSSELIALPERVRTNLLGRIENASWFTSRRPKQSSNSDISD